MKVEEFKTLLTERLEATVDKDDDDICTSFTARSAKGIGVRPEKVAELPDGRNVYMLTRAQAKRILNKLEKAGV